MKFFFLLLLPTLSFAQIFIKEEISSAEPKVFNVADDVYDLRAENWKSYLTDSCTRYHAHVQNEEEMRAAGMRRCEDGSISFVQPPSEGWNGWEGKCGPTAASNSLYHMCKVALDPDKYISSVMRDATPGVRPKTLQRGMGKIFNLNKQHCPDTQNWIRSSVRNSQSYIEKIKKHLIPNYSHMNLITINRDGEQKLRNPVIALIQNPGGKYLHWVTIVDVNSKNNQCNFVVNHWDNQYVVPCNIFSKWAGKVGRTYPLILKSYSLVTYR